MYIVQCSFITAPQIPQCWRMGLNPRLLAYHFKRRCRLYRSFSYKHPPTQRIVEYSTQYMKLVQFGCKH